jgi:signal peptidase I
MNTLLLAALVILSLAAVVATFLRLAAWWVKTPRRSLLKAYTLTLVGTMFVVGVLIVAELTLGLDPPTWRAWVPTGLVIVGGVWLLFWWRFRTSLVGTWRVAICAAASLGTVVGLWLLLIDPFLLVTVWTSRSGSMSPSSRGLHAIQTCRHCGGELIVSVVLSDEQLAAGEAQRFRFAAICADCLRPDYVGERFETIRPRDHSLVNRTKVPRRWDQVSFYSPVRPDDHEMLARLPGVTPDTVLGKRVVGLPGEEVVIRDGAVWADGQRQEPPPGVPRIAYTRGSDVKSKQKYWGEPDRPATLGPDEFFMLGDNTAISGDSRLFGPVPRENIIGVEDVTYWPPSRWRFGQ